MAYTDIDKSDEYFNTKLYTGNNNVTQTITGVGFQPDLVWIKNRDNVENHYLFDAVRGSGAILNSSSTNAEADLPVNTKPTIASDGFTLTSNGTNDELNFGTRTYVSWNWKANGAGVSNTAGSITSTVSANTTSGFSIVSYTGNGTGGATIGHGLGVTPKMIIIKGTGTTYNWVVGHNSLSTNWGKYLTLSTTDAVETATNVFNDTAPTSSLFSIGTALGVNTSSSNYIAYCFAEKKGFSKFGSYTGNGSADGPFVYTGFSPAFVMVKRTNTTSDWAIWDTARSTYNVVGDYLLPNTSGAEGNASYIDVLSNGFKIRSSSVFNTTSDSIIYMAFAENPFVTSTSIPTTAR
jgi:hypothetical protein